MGVPFAGAALFVGLTSLPHPDWFVHHATWLMNTVSPCDPNLPPDQYANCQELEGSFNSAASTVANVILYTIIAIVAWLVFTVVAMCLYKTKVHDMKPKIAEGNKTMESGKFHFGLCDCFSNCNECLCSFCCTGLRFADTHSSVTTTGFWLSFIMFFVMNSVISSVGFAIGGAVGGDQALNIGVWSSAIGRGLFFGIWSRGEIRKKLGSPDGDASSKIVDILSWALCFPCAMTQEAVEVDIAADVHIACPWTLTIGRANALGVKAREVAPAEYEAMVGDAVLLDGR